MRRDFLEYLRSRASKRTLLEQSEVKRERTLRHEFVLIESLQDLLTGLGQIPHAIVGGHAVAFHGFPRTTSDVDVLTRPDDAYAAATALGLQHTSPLSLGGVAGTLPSGQEIDIVAPNQPWVDAAIQSGVNTPYGRMVAAPYLVLMKLWASRGAQDDTDMLHVLKKMTPEQLKQTKQIIKRYLPNEVEDLDSLISMRQYA